MVPNNERVRLLVRLSVVWRSMNSPSMRHSDALGGTAGKIAPASIRSAWRLLDLARNPLLILVECAVKARAIALAAAVGVDGKAAAFAGLLFEGKAPDPSVGTSPRAIQFAIIIHSRRVTGGDSIVD